MRKRAPRAFALIAPLLAVAACNSTETLDPAAIRAGGQNGPINALAPGEPSGAASAPTIARGDFRLRVAPVVGASVDAALPLGRRLAEQAARRGLAVTGNADPSAYLLKGYFSAFAEGRETLVIYVWDILGPAGDRLHRMQGQERVAATAADAWSAVPASTMEAIADRTVEQLDAWLETRQG